MLNQRTSTRALDIESEIQEFEDIDTKIVKWTSKLDSLTRKIYSPAFPEYWIVKIENSHDGYGVTTMYTIQNEEDHKVESFYRLKSAKAYLLSDTKEELYDELLEIKEEEAKKKRSEKRELEDLLAKKEELEKKVEYVQGKIHRSDNIKYERGDAEARMHGYTQRNMMQEEIFDFQRHIKSIYAHILHHMEKLGMSTIDMESEYLAFIIELTKSKLAFYDLEEDVKHLGKRKSRLKFLKKYKGKKELSKQNSTEPLTLESLCPWGKHEGIEIYNIDADWLLATYEEYSCKEVEDKQLQRLLDLIEDKLDVIAETF